MSRESASQIYQGLIAAGYSRDAAIVQTAIALAESGGDPVALGDTNLENATWGPSFGLFQIRTLKQQTGSGKDRDVSWLAASDSNQDAAAYQISNRGTDFSPWTTYTSGAYQRFLPQAQAAAGGDTTGTLVSDQTATPFPTWGPSWLPWDLPSDAGNALYGTATSAISGTLGNVRSIVVEGVFVALGLGVLAMGAYATVRRGKGSNDDG